MRAWPLLWERRQQGQHVWEYVWGRGGRKVHATLCKSKHSIVIWHWPSLLSFHTMYHRYLNNLNHRMKAYAWLWWWDPPCECRKANTLHVATWSRHTIRCRLSSCHVDDIQPSNEWLQRKVEVNVENRLYIFNEHICQCTMYMSLTSSYPCVVVLVVKHISPTCRNSPGHNLLGYDKSSACYRLSSLKWNQLIEFHSGPPITTWFDWVIRQCQLLQLKSSSIQHSHHAKTSLVDSHRKDPIKPQPCSLHLRHV